MAATRFPANSVFELKHKHIRALDSREMYYGNGGMGIIPQSMAKSGNFKVEQDVWVRPNNGVKYNKSSRQWSVKGNGKLFGEYDYLVIAHNGKCADRLMPRTPAKDIHQLLRTNFAPTVPKHGGKR